MRNLVKVYLDQLEDKAKIKLQSTDPILLWLIRWVAMAYSRFKVGADGKTNYERQKGRKCLLEVVPSGGGVRFKQLGETAAQRNSLESSWSEGVWLGHARGSSEALVGTASGVIRAWTIRRMPEGERWNADAISKMQWTPSRPSTAMPGLHIPIAINIEEGKLAGAPVETTQRQEEKKARRVYLKATGFDAHGYTDGCDGCARLQAGMDPRPHMNMDLQRKMKVVELELSN